MKISDQGLAALELEEGVVLRAYRDVAGVWTIGAGLTAASGVVKPAAGMVITRQEADELLREALRRYEAEVEIAMTVTTNAVTRPQQNEFDAGLSFHWNTGAIGKASWVRRWQQKAARAVIIDSLKQWARSGGKVLPSLEARREREALMLLDGVYRTPAPAGAPHPVWPTWALQMTEAERQKVCAGFETLGYGASLDKAAVLSFQRDHGLITDGIIGRATLTTLQRALDARTKSQAPMAVTGVAIGSAVTGLTDQITSLPHADAATLVGAAVWLFAHAWGYRDIVAASLTSSFPRFAAFLRSF